MLIGGTVGSMASVCTHGLEASECLICKTLGTGPDQATTTQDLKAGWSRMGLGDHAQVPAKPDVVYLPGAVGRRPRSLGLHLVLILAAVVVAALVVWLLAGAVLAILHVIELIVVAGAAGWAGYRLGHYRGSRRHTGD